MSALIGVRHLARIAGDYCEHQSLGRTCQGCIDTVADVVHAMQTAGYRVASGPEPWCPECFEAPEPSGTWAPPGDRCADEHVLPWMSARKTTA